MNSKTKLTPISNADFWHTVIDNNGEYQWKNGDGIWINDSIHKNPIPASVDIFYWKDYRLYEPVYEYQWLYKVGNGYEYNDNFFITSDYFTEIEICIKNAIKVEESKRLRI